MDTTTAPAITTATVTVQVEFDYRDEFDGYALVQDAYTVTATDVATAIRQFVRATAHLTDVEVVHVGTPRY